MEIVTAKLRAMSVMTEPADARNISEPQSRARAITPSRRERRIPSDQISQAMARPMNQ